MVNWGQACNSAIQVLRKPLSQLSANLLLSRTNFTAQNENCRIAGLTPVIGNQGFRHLGSSADGSKVTAYHLQAEIAAIHATAATDVDTDWAKVVKLYGQLYELEPTPIVALNRAVALSRWQGPEAAILSLEGLAKNRALRSYHLLPAVLGELWKQLGDFERAAKAYRKALNCDCTAPERRFLESQLRMVATRLEHG
jgi:RNA polymerase sigma-70 factor (ECF subfamily)